MTLTTGHVILACLVAMVAAAPTADHRTDGQEAAVSLRGDNGALTRAKRAEEQVVYGNQQNVAKAPASAAKKSVVGGFHFPPLMPSGLLPPDSPPEGADTFPSFPQHFGNKVDLGAYPYFASKPQRPKGEPDKAGFMYASQQRPIAVNPVLEETASELQAAAPEPASGEGGSEEEGEAGKQTESPEQKNTAQSTVSKAGEEKPTAEPVQGKPDEPTPQQSPDAEESEKGGEDSWESSEAQMKSVAAAAAAPSPSSQAVESEVRISQGSGPPLDSRLADAEEALHAKDQAMERDDMEIFLKELQQPSPAAASYDKAKVVEEEEDAKDAGLEEAKEEKEKEGEGSAEAELMEVMDPDAEAAAEKSGAAESGDYTKELLKYILLNGNEYGRVPVSYPGGFPSYSSPYYARRRRSLARRGLPHIHRRRRSGRPEAATGKPQQQLGRSKRTKRDLLGDELYYTPDAQYALQQAMEEEEEEERQAEMEDLISYLMALYPAIYDNQPPPRGSAYPGYMWYGNNYPAEEAYPEWEAPEYMEAPIAEWEPPTQPVPAWEPAFYPEEVEEQGYYPAPGKRVSRRGRRQFQRRDSAYPYGQEAYWGAFMQAPGDRAYEDAYQRLQDLATVLGDARQPPAYSPDAFSDYKKK